MAAQVVGAALHVAHAQIADQGFKKGNVAEEELVLERLGTGGDNHALTGAQSGEQISQSLAGSGAGFDDEMATLGESALHGLRHFKLTRPVFVGQRRTRKNAARGKEFEQGGQGAG